MANIKLTDNNWEASGVYDLAQQKNQRQINAEQADLKSAISDPVTGLDSKAPVIIDSASGTIAAFPDGADGLPIHKLTVQIEPVQAGSGDPSPNNVRPITGWTECNVTRTGKNLWGGDAVKNDVLSLSGSKGKTQNEEVYFDATCIGDLASNVPFKANTQYTIILNLYRSTAKNAGLTYGSNLGVRYSDGTTTNLMLISSGDAVYSTLLFVTEAGKTFSNLFVYNNGAYTYLKYNKCGIFEGVLTADDFASYSGATIPIPFPDSAGTVYGGTLSINDDGTGALIVDYFRFKLSSVKWSYQSAYGGCFRSNAYYTSALNGADGLCEVYKPVNSVSSDKDITFRSMYWDSNKRIVIKDSTFGSDVMALTSFLSDGNYYAVTRFNPVTYQLTAQQVLETLYGTNNIWADCGDIELEYRADTKLAIQKINAPADDDMTADAQIASGKYFIIGGNLYLSTTTIPAGDTIIPGTNCTKTNLAEALNALNT